MSDSLERRIGDKLIESFEIMQESRYNGPTKRI